MACVCVQSAQLSTRGTSVTANQYNFRRVKRSPWYCLCSMEMAWAWLLAKELTPQTTCNRNTPPNMPGKLVDKLAVLMGGAGLPSTSRSRSVEVIACTAFEGISKYQVEYKISNLATPEKWVNTIGVARNVLPLPAVLDNEHEYAIKKLIDFDNVSFVMIFVSEVCKGAPRGDFTRFSVQPVQQHWPTFKSFKLVRYSPGSVPTETFHWMWHPSVMSQ